MRKITREELFTMSKVPRLNLINCVTGYKSANLIGTVSNEGVLNLAIFSSVTHLGSEPPLLGFILRPTTVPRDTYKNLKETGYFTVNHITEEMIADAHHTSSSYDEHISEFDKTNLEPEFIENHKVPFVKNSPVQLLCKYVNEYKIEENDCIHIIASIETIYANEHLFYDDNWLQLDRGNVIAINGLDGYALPKLVDRFHYARPDKTTLSML
ncbi:flavin reductase family protein [Flavobacterium channae]|uniref:flavin reductase family protein n=1 Tax=Flavobacterium channae TaxID=2897181 RepID=UPI001E39FFD2|nr:flavin reductase family protein [Flavobacterium channae]UGS24042.1 flavin reductase family protein [Flavobacterium channae]